MILEVVPPDRPRPTRSVGKVHDDDSIEPRGSGSTPGGRVFDHVVKGRFVGDSFTGQAEPPARPCSLQLSRTTPP
jgi:hypothetical protein